MIALAMATQHMPNPLNFKRKITRTKRSISKPFLTTPPAAFVSQTRKGSVQRVRSAEAPHVPRATIPSPTRPTLFVSIVGVPCLSWSQHGAGHNDVQRKRDGTRREDRHEDVGKRARERAFVGRASERVSECECLEARRCACVCVCVCVCGCGWVGGWACRGWPRKRPRTHTQSLWWPSFNRRKNSYHLHLCVKVAYIIA